MRESQRGMQPVRYTHARRNGAPTLVSARGFTLVEVLVVLVLIGITVSIVTLSVGSSGERQAEEEARRLVALVELASDEAVLKSEEVGIFFRPDGYEFYLLAADNSWKPMEDPILRVRTLPKGFALAASVDGLPIRMDRPPESPAPHGFLLSSGERSAFDVELGPENGARYRVSVPVVGDPEVTGPIDAGSRR